MTAAALVALVALAAPPKPPVLVERGGATLQAQWSAIKDIAEPFEQVKQIAEKTLDRARCTGTVELMELLRTTDLPLRLRDTVRWRTSASPEMAALMAAALQELRGKHPDAVVTMGDVAQPGCGQIRYGTLVKLHDKKETAAFVAEARWAFGALTTFVAEDRDAYMDEWPRFHETLGPVWVERRLTAQSKGGEGRVETRRFGAGRRLGPDSIHRLMKRTRERLRDRRHVTWDTVLHDMGAGPVKVRRAQWAHAGKSRWMELILAPRQGHKARRRKKRRKGRYQPIDILRIREASLDMRKPTSRKMEERYRFFHDGEAGVHITRHMLRYEAHHSSHLAGYDADLSYITYNNASHFAPDPSSIDAVRTWAWMKALHNQSKALKIPLLALFVDRSILNVLKDANVASRRDPTWRKLRRSSGHDSHVHVRVGRAAPWSGRRMSEIKKRLDL